MIIQEDKIQKLICDRLGVSQEAVKTKSRDGDLKEARRIMSYVMLEFTKKGLSYIAYINGYKTHPEVIRDHKVVSTYLNLYTDYSTRMRPIIEEARVLIRSIYKSGTLERGDLCWFWNRKMEIPYFGRLKGIRINKYGRYEYTSSNFKGVKFNHCVYAGEKNLPVEFLNWIIARKTPENNQLKKIA
jgi:hypothetical protein